MSDHDELFRIFQAHEPTVDWSDLGPIDPTDTVWAGTEKWTLTLEGLQVAFVFDDEGKLLGAYNWKE